MTDGWMQASGEVVRGHRVASGACGDPRFPAGTIAPQLPFFRAGIADFEAYLGGPAFAGTINLNFPGRTVILRTPELRLAAVRWTARFPPENFLLSRCRLRWDGGAGRPAFLYIPDPATKPDHHQASSVVEILGGFMPGLAYGTPVELNYRADAIEIA